MFTVDEPTADAIRRAWEEGGELAGIVELRRHFPLLTDNAHARQCVRMIASWQPFSALPSSSGKPGRGASSRSRRHP